MIRVSKIAMVLLVSIFFSFKLFAGGQSEESTSTEGTSEDPVVLRFAETNANDDPIVVAAKRFADKVSERTDGRIKIEIFPSGQLGGNADVLKSLQMGAIDITRVKPGHLS